MLVYIDGAKDSVVHQRQNQGSAPLDVTRISMVRSDAEVEMMHAPFVQKPVIVHEGTVKLAHVRREVFALADFIL